MKEFDDSLDDNRVEEILQGAGRRTPIPWAAREKFEEAFRTELELTQQRHQRGRWYAGVGLAASVLMAVVFLFQPTESDRMTVAAVISDQDEVNWAYGDDAGPLRTGNQIQMHDVIETGRGMVSLRPDGTDLDIRLAPESSIRFNDRDSLTLLRGAVYVDSGGGKDSFQVFAGELLIRHIGTQYLVAKNEAEVEVAVREGELQIQQGAETHSSKSGPGVGQLTVFLNGNLMTTQNISTHDARWTWVAELSPTIETDKMRVVDFLKWLSDQTGYRIIYEVDPGSSAINGTVPTNSAMNALDEVMILSDYAADVDEENGTITIRLSSSSE